MHARLVVPLILAGTASTARLAVSQATPSSAGSTSIVQELQELNIVAKGYAANATSAHTTIDNAGIAADSESKVLAFIGDPLCRNPGGSASRTWATLLTRLGVKASDPARTWCEAAFSPFSSDATHKLLTPSYDLIHRMAVALAPQNPADQSRNTNLAGLVPPAASPAAAASPPAAPGITAAEAVKDFVVNRAKDELVVTFALDLKERISNDTILQKVMSNTLTAMGALDSRSVKELLPSLRTAFAQDLDSLPIRLADHRVVVAVKREVTAAFKGKTDSANIAAAFDTLTSKLPTVFAVVKCLYPIAKGANALNALASLEHVDAASISDADLRAALVTIGIAAREYRYGGATLTAAVSDPYARELVLALFIRDVAVDVSDNAELVAWTTSLGKDKQGSFSRMIAGVDDLRGEISGFAVQYSAASTGSARVALASSEAIRVTNETLGLIAPFVNNSKWSEIQTTVAEIASMQSEAAAKEYVTLTLHAGAFAKEHFGFSVPQSYALALNTAAAIASAQTSDEITSALEAAAEPVLSFRAKRTISSSGRALFGINGYVGLGGGVENAFARGIQGAKAKYVGMTVPIGAEWSVANNAGSLSFFVPLVDLGTIGTFRLSNDANTQATPNVNLSQLVAPGAFVVVGITRDYPISLGIGAQYVSNLRKDASNQAMNVVRGSAWLAVDVPLFHF